MVGGTETARALNVIVLSLGSISVAVLLIWCGAGTWSLDASLYDPAAK